MPLYEYECRKCHHRFERIQKFSDKPVRRCPKCKTGRVEKLISSPAVHFKGTGWYVTDYGSKKSSGGDKPESGDKSQNGKSESGKSEEKSASRGSSAKDASSKKSDKS